MGCDPHRVLILPLQADGVRNAPGELMLPVVMRYVGRMQQMDTAGRLMPTANYSLPAGETESAR